MEEMKQCYLCRNGETSDIMESNTDSLFVHKTCLQKLIHQTNKYNATYLPSENSCIIEQMNGLKIHMKGCKMNYTVNESGQKHGLYEEWYNYETWDENGKIKIRCNYVNGIKEGLYERWRENGKLSERYTYVNDIKEGLEEWWHKNGKRYLRRNYVAGKLEGLYESWWDTGNMMKRCYYVNDKLEGLCETWHDNGIKSSKTNYVADKKNGLYEEWWKNGILSHKYNIVNGKIEGLEERWYEDGTIDIRYTYDEYGNRTILK